MSSVQTRTDEGGVTNVSFAVADALVEFVISGEPSKGFEVSLLIDGRPQSTDQIPPNWGTDLDEAPLPVALLGGLSPLGARDTTALFWSVTPVGNPPAFTTSREPDKLVTPSIVWSGAAELSVSTVPYSLLTEEAEFAFDLDIEATNDGSCQKAKQ